MVLVVRSSEEEIKCTQASCYKQTVSATVVRCVDGFSCYGATIACPDGVDEVEVECQQKYSCYGAQLSGSCQFTVDCQSGYECPAEQGDVAEAFSARARGWSRLNSSSARARGWSRLNSSSARAPWNSSSARAWVPNMRGMDAPRTGDKNVSMTSNLLAFGVVAVLVVLLTVNVTCLFMKGQQEKEQNMEI